MASIHGFFALGGAASGSGSTDAEESVIALESAVDMEGEKAFSKGVLFARAGRADRAIRALESARLSPIPALTTRALEEMAKICMGKGDFPQAREYGILRYDKLQGKEYSSAYLVEQNEYAICTGLDLGTSSIGECIAIAIYHPESGMIGLAHVDVRTEEESVGAFLAEFPSGVLSVTIIGGNSKDELLTVSVSNKEKVLRAVLARAEVELTDRTLDVAHPSAFVITKDGVIVDDSIPVKGIELRHVRGALSTFSTSPRPLRKAYELKGDIIEEAELRIPEQVIREVSPYFKVEEGELMKRLSPTGTEISTFTVHEALALKNYIESVAC